MFLSALGPMPEVSDGVVDACKMIVGPAVVVVVLPDIGLGPTATPDQLSFYSECMPARNIVSMISLTQGDEVGDLMGVLSELIMATAICTEGSENLFVGGPNAIKLTSPTIQNGINAIGIIKSPAGTTILVLG